MLPRTKVKVEGTELTALVDTRASASFLQMDWTKQIAIEIYTSQDACKVQKAMGQEKMVSKQDQSNVEIARFNIPHTFLVGEISPNCILGSDFLAKIAAEVDFKANKLCLHQGDKIRIALVREKTCNQEEEIKGKKRLLL